MDGRGGLKRFVEQEAEQLLMGRRRSATTETGYPRTSSRSFVIVDLLAGALKN